MWDTPTKVRGTKNLKKIIYDPFIFAKNSVSEFDPLTVTGMALCVDLGPKCQNLFCIAESSLA